MTEIILTSSALILFLIIIRKLLRGRINPTLQYALWLLVAARLLIPGTLFASPVSLIGTADPLLSSIEESLYPENSPPAISDAYVPATPDTILPDAIIDYDDTVVTYYPPQATAPVINQTTNWIEVIWKLGIIAVSSTLLFSNLLFYVDLQKKRRSLSPTELPRPCRTRVYVVPSLTSPCLFGLVRPAIYLNEDALSAEGLEHILTHEETHLRHGDHIWAILRSLCLAVHWYNPLVWWAALLSRRDCELSCDAGAIRRLGEESRISYGETLLRMIVPGRRTGDLLRTATTMTAEKRTMTERITLIAKRPKMLKITLAVVILLMFAAIIFVFGGSAEKPAEPNTDQITADFPADDENTTDTDTSTGIVDQITAHELYVRARDFWNWFEFGTFPTTGTTLQTEDGTMLQLDGFDTLESLRWQLEAYFSPTLTEHLLTNYTRFQESDGKLFVLPTNRGSNIYAGEETFKAFPLTEAEAAQQGYDCHIYSTTEVLDFYVPDTVLYQKRHDWYMAWNGQNYVFTSFGPYDDVDPQKYYNVLTILDHYDRGNTITTWFPVLAYLDWNALYATQDQWPEGFDLGMYILTSVSERIASEESLTPAVMNHILSATEGLDGAYAEQYQFIVYELYKKDPAAFAYTVLETLQGSYQTQVIDFFRYEEQYHRSPSADITPMTRDESIALLRKNMTDLLSASPTSMHFDQPGQQEQLLPVNAYGISAASYTSSDPNVATVNDLGFVTAVNPGSATITLHYEGAAGQKDLTCAVSCEWKEETEEPDGSDEPELPPYADAEAVNSYMRGYAPTVWEAGSPSGIETTLSDNWTMDGIRAALFQAVSARLQGTMLENDLARIELSPQFQFPETMSDGVVMNVPFYAHYERESIILPSGASYTPAMRGQEATATVTLVGSGTTAPVDDEFAQKQQDYQLLKACVPIEGGIQVSASAEDFDVTAYIRDTVDANLAAAGLSGRYFLQAISTGSYTNPVWVDPGYEQTVFYEVSFASSDGSGIDAVSMQGEVLVTTIE